MSHVVSIEWNFYFSPKKCNKSQCYALELKFDKYTSLFNQNAKMHVSLKSKKYILLNYFKWENG